MEATPRKLDRRIVRTRELLRAALLDLIVEQGYDALTIQHITDRANLRRATFYMHYRDKEELLLDAISAITHELEDEVLHMQFEDGLGGKTRPEAYLVLLRHAEQYHALYRNIFNSHNGMRFAAGLQDRIAGIILRGLEQTGRPTDVPPVVIAQYIAATEMSLLIWWLNHERPYSTEQMAAYLHRLTLKGVGAYAADGFRE
ncbi:MAG: TetR/AcrR family transcriptional regulator [Anaerolinea sp.]|nr:TetR/AcrR family transcriptional regulator [Anaerolinea sp.]